MKTTEKILKELGLILLLFFALAFLARTIISFRMENDKKASKKDMEQMQEMKEHHRSEGREIQLY